MSINMSEPPGVGFFAFTSTSAFVLSCEISPDFFLPAEACKRSETRLLKPPGAEPAGGGATTFRGFKRNAGQI